MGDEGSEKWVSYLAIIILAFHMMSRQSHCRVRRKKNQRHIDAAKLASSLDLYFVYLIPSPFVTI